MIMIPVTATGTILGNGLRPLSHHTLLGALPPLQLPPLPGTATTQSYLVESLLRERGYHLARPVATKPTVTTNASTCGGGGLLLTHDDQVEYYKEEAARHYLGLLGRSVSQPQQQQESHSPGAQRGGTPSPGPRTSITSTSDDPSVCGEETSPSPPNPIISAQRPPLKFSVTAILGEDSRSSSGTPQPQEYGNYTCSKSYDYPIRATNKCNAL